MMNSTENYPSIETIDSSLHMENASSSPEDHSAVSDNTAGHEPTESEDIDSTTVSPNNIENKRELDSGYRIITEIIRQNKTTCWPFMDAVDAEGLGLWDYHHRIKTPMWLNKIVDNFEKNCYTRFANFAKDFRIMVENCYRYNTTEHPISKKAKKLEILFEAKLALLKNDIRESATIAKTSNGRFATLVNDSNSTMRSGRVSVPSNNCIRDTDMENQTRLVYDFVRCEEAALAEDERMRGYREHKQQQTLYQQIAAAFVSSLETQENAKHIKTCHCLPEIGLFLHLTETTLKLPPLVMYSLEMSLLIPDDSLYIAKIMTSFLCTYYERSLVPQRPPMQFKTWENRLKQRVEKWFELVLKYSSYQLAADKLLIGVDFFHSLNWKNPFYTDDGQERSFLNFTYDEKAVIVKALCDNLTTFQSVQNSISALSCEQSRAMSLGFDVSGNEYTYFPQFCGDDFRVYRHRQFGDLPEYEAPDPLLTLPILKKSVDVKDDMSAMETEKIEESVQTSNGNQHDAKFESAKSSDDWSEVITGDVTNQDKDPTVGETKEEVVPTEDRQSPIKELNGEVIPSEEKIESVENAPDDLEPTKPTPEVCSHAAKLEADTQEKANDEVTDESKGDEAAEDVSANYMLVKSRLLNAVASSRQAKLKPTDSAGGNEESENCYDSGDAQWTPSCGTPKKKKKKISVDSLSASPLRRSSRKRAAVNYSSLLVANDTDNTASDLGDVEAFQPKKRQKRPPRQRSKKKTAPVIKVKEPDEEYGSIEFEMICENLDSLRQLIATQQSEHEDAVKEKKSKKIIENVSSLIGRLEWLLDELSSYESHLEKARFDAKIQLKREHDELFRAATTGRAIQSTAPDVDPWEEELISKNTSLQMDGGSIYTPPASIYLEESDDESDRELRRSKRRPKRYESDEDYTVDSSDEGTYQTTSLFYNEYDENRQHLLPAALEELEVRLQRQAVALQKMMGNGRVTRQSEFGDASQILTNERRTRQRSKKENKVFRKVLLLALKDKEMFGPSLLPLMKTDVSEIGEVVERVLAQEAIARQQRKLEREEEQKRKRSLKQEILQKNKEIQAKRRAAKKLVEKYKSERHESKPEATKVASTTSMWSPPKKQTLPAVATPLSRSNSSAVSNKAENVMIRLQNGKIGQALRFPDGRVIPIMRMDETSKRVESSAPPASQEQRKPVTFHPHISLSGHRASVLRQAQHLQTPAAPVATSAQESATVVTGTSNVVTKPLSHVSASSKLHFVATTPPMRTVCQPPRQAIPVFRPSLPTTAVSQRLTLPSGQVINLVVKQPAVAPQSAEDKSASKSLGRLFVDNVTGTFNDTTLPLKHSAPHSLPPRVPAASSTVAMSPSSRMTAPVPQHPGSLGFPPPRSATKVLSKPLGIVSPMQVKQPSSSNINVGQRQSVNKSHVASVSGADNSYLLSSQQQQQQSGYISPQSTLTRYNDSNVVRNSQEHQSTVSSPQHLQVGMQNVALVSQPMYRPATAQQVQFVPALVAGSVPLVQPVQFVQTVPLQVSAPVMFMAQGQPHLPLGEGSDSRRQSFPPSSSPATTSISQSH